MNLLRFLACLPMMAGILVGAAWAEPEVSQPTPANKPVVALVLGGGGALGFTHIGVIEELEKAGVEPDIVVGTSVGAIVGSLYSAGYSAEEIARFAEDSDWAELFRNGGGRDTRAFRRKEDERLFPTALSLAVKDGRVELPKGVLGGQRLKRRLTGLIAEKTTATDFDRLPRRFRAVATNIETFEPIVLSKGSLPESVFASMAVPGAIAPQEIDGLTLIDGGLSQNLPVSVARAMGADIIIAVNLTMKPKKADEIENVVDVLAQVSVFATLENAERSVNALSGRDVLITPDIGEHSPVDFDAAKDLIAAGRAAAKAEAIKLAEIGAEHGEEQPHAGAPSLIVAVEIENETTYSDKLIRKSITQKIDAPLDYPQIEKDIDRLTGYDAFGAVDYQVKSRAPGEDVLVIHVPERRTGNSQIRAGVDIATNFDNDTQFNLAVGHIVHNLNARGAELRSVFRAGDDPLISTEFFQPTNIRQDWFVSLSLAGAREFVRNYRDGDVLSEFKLDNARVEGAIGRVIDRKIDLRAGISYERGRLSNSIGYPGAPKVKYEDASVFARATIDSFDNAFFPDNGVFGSIEYRTAIAGDRGQFDRSRFGVDLTAVKNIGAGSLIAATSLGFATDERGGAMLANPYVFEGFETLGGPFRLSGLTRGELRGRHKTYGALGYYRRITRGEALFSIPLYVGGLFEAGNVFDTIDQWRAADLLYGGSVFIGSETLLGPIFLGFGYAEGGSTSAFVEIGKSF